MEITRYRYVKLRDGFTFMEAEVKKEGKKYYVNISITPGEKTSMDVYSDGCEMWVYNCPVDEVDLGEPEKYYEDDFDAEDVVAQMVARWNENPRVTFGGRVEFTDWICW